MMCVTCEKALHIHAVEVRPAWQCLQGAKDHVERLQAHVQTLEQELSQVKAAKAESTSKFQEQIQTLELDLSQARAAKARATQASASQSQLTHLKARLADSDSAANRLRQKLREVEAEVLALKEGQGGSNKASDVIQALEIQVQAVVCMPHHAC